MTIQRLPRILLALTLIIASLVSPLARAQNQSASIGLAEKLAAIERQSKQNALNWACLGSPSPLSKTTRRSSKRLRFARCRTQSAGDRRHALRHRLLLESFTAMGVVISQDEGKLSLDDSPKKHLPYFKLQDPEADAKITVRDLLHHSLGWTGRTSPGTRARSTAKKRSRSPAWRNPRQNSARNFCTRTVCTARRAKSSDAPIRLPGKLIAERSLKPLGMKSSDASVKQMVKAADYATGYSLEDKKTKKAMLRDLTNIAWPAPLTPTSKICRNGRG